jgi:MerR family transcriptional regulator, copper efflux regulator
LRFIEECKQQNLSLQEIKDALIRRNENKPDIVHQANDVANQIHNLKENIEDLLPLIKNLDENERKLITKRLSPETVTLIQSLLLLLG